MQISYQGKATNVKNPNVCPHCHVVNSPHELWKIQTVDTDNVSCVISAWSCSNDSCKKVFVALYKLIGETYRLTRFLNGYPKGPIWPQPIEKLRTGKPVNPEQPEQTKFIKTYLQSLNAENCGLDELAGMGYRKSIEYLVKDWAIQSKPADQEKIEKSWLGAVIKDYYSGDLKDILDRATWLGNDQSHYNKLFDEYDLEILKELIDLIMVELDRQFKKQHFIETINKR